MRLAAADLQGNPYLRNGGARLTNPLRSECLKFRCRGVRFGS